MRWQSREDVAGWRVVLEAVAQMDLVADFDILKRHRFFQPSALCEVVAVLSGRALCDADWRILEHADD